MKTKVLFVKIAGQWELDNIFRGDDIPNPVMIGEIDKRLVERYGPGSYVWIDLPVIN